MNRIFGYGKNRKTSEQILKESNHAMTQAQQSLQTRISKLDTDISQLNMQLTNIQKRLSTIKSPQGQKPLRSQALKLLNKRKKLEQMRDSLDNQEWSMIQAQMMTDTLQNTMISVNALKQHNSILKQQYGKIDIDNLEDMKDEMVDLIEKGEELQNALNLNMNGNLMEDDIDEDELDAELDALAEEEPEWGEDLLNSNINLNEEYMNNNNNNNNLEVVNNDKIPSYLCGTIPEFIDEDNETQQENTKNNTTKTAEGVTITSTQ
ncbi:Vps60p PWA37_005167 [Arxiozyma heterogenica]|uniref:Vps60p n=1 Tax=Arxiozyma heterogenica TaxID=278026 RepID=UPI002EF7D12C